MPTLTRTLEVDIDFEGERASREDNYDYDISRAVILIWDRKSHKHRSVELELTPEQKTQLCEMYAAELDEDMDDE